MSTTQREDPFVVSTFEYRGYSVEVWRQPLSWDGKKPFRGAIYHNGVFTCHSAHSNTEETATDSSKKRIEKLISAFVAKIPYVGVL